MATARRYEELIAWQLAVQVRDRINALTAEGRISNDARFRDQIRDAAASAPRNLAEGFARFNPREFARFARIARASLAETRNHIQDARERHYLSDQETEDLLRQTTRALAATTSLLRYLHSCKGRAPTGWDPAPPQPTTPDGER